MKMRLLSIGLVAMALVTPMQISHAEDAVEKKKPEFADMTVEQVQAAIKEGKVTIIDVNGKKRYDAGHVPGAKHFPAIMKSGLAKALPKDKNALIVTYCGGPQ